MSSFQGWRGPGNGRIRARSKGTGSDAGKFHRSGKKNAKAQLFTPPIMHAAPIFFHANVQESGSACGCAAPRQASPAMAGDGRRSPAIAGGFGPME